MPGPTEKTLFQRALLASQLVGAAELVEVASTLPQDGSIIGGAADDRLAQQLIQRGLLNHWQVEQLRAGRTKFTLGPYLIVDAIGKGGMGHVFKGRHEMLGRIEAIKVLPKARSNAQSVANFQHEIRAQAQLDHPNLVRVTFADKDGDTYFLVTEFVPGIDLRRLVRKRGAIAPDQAAAIIMQTAEALEYAHRRGLVHRDVKPGNLLIRPDGVVKITDLGLAWYLEDSFGAAPARQGKVVGTCDYLAPESIATPDRIMPVSDIYSLGCTLYYAVTGKVPFPGGNVAEKLHRQANDQPINPRNFRADIPAGLCELIAEMMAKDHQERTPTAAAVAARLRPFVNDDSQQELASFVESCLKEAPARGGSGGSSHDLGETLESLSSASVDASSRSNDASSRNNDASSQKNIEIKRQAKQRTEPIGNSALETRDDLAWRKPHDSPPPRANRLIRLTVALAALATLAILVAVLVRNL